jgi:hypothetical protein
MEQTRVLPPISKRPMDHALVRDLLHQAITATLAALSGLEAPTQQRMIYRPTSSGINGEWLPCPNYSHRLVWDRFEEICHIPESEALLNYLWDHGARTLTLHGPNPDKAGWAGHVYAELLRYPIMALLDRSATERLVDSETVKQWSINLHDLDATLDDLTTVCCEDRQCVHVVCPLHGFMLDHITEFQLAEDIWLRVWSERDYALFRTQYPASGFRLGRSIADGTNLVVELTLSAQFISSGPYPHPITEDVPGLLDLVKWTAFLATQSNTVLVEGTAVVCDVLGTLLGEVRRDLNECNYWHGVSLPQLQHTAELVRDYRDTAILAPDLAFALWYFGRACTAALDRDMLAESVIGLESLLVPNSGENRYRFGLHGAAVLSTLGWDGRTTRRDLKRLYDVRSKAVHGTQTALDHDQALLARRMLADCIQATIGLVQESKLKSPRNVATSVEEYVFDRAVSGTTAPDPNLGDHESPVQ